MFCMHSLADKLGNLQCQFSSYSFKVCIVKHYNFVKKTYFKGKKKNTGNSYTTSDL